MKTSAGTLRTTTYLLLALLISGSLAACGGGGGSSSPGTSGPATVRVSIASAPSGTTSTPSIATSSPTTAASSGNSTTFDNVYVSVTKLALIPSNGPESPSPGGELEKSDSDDPDGAGFVTTTFSPITIDLRHLNTSTGDNAATLLNQFSSVPAGEYSKIRVYYDNVVGQPGNVLFHQTAHYHFDVHFVGGNLVIPFATNPVGGIRFYSVVIDVVGLKITSNNSNTLLRPQVFAKVVEAPKYIVTGVADQVNHTNGTFVVKAVNDNISAAYGSGTNWFYVDGRIVGPFGSSGANALQNTAIVDVIGTFSSDNVLIATEVDITFPDVRQGTADNVWILDNTAFIVRSLTDNVTVFPAPNRSGAYYDNSTSPFDLLNYTDIKNGIQVKARGYFNSYPDLDAYWISVGP